MAIEIRLKKYKNKTKSSYGKWYAQTVTLGTVGTKEIAQHICQNSSFTEGDVLGVLQQLTGEMQRALQSGMAVRMDGIGRFRIVAESVGVRNQSDFNIQKHIKGVRIKFLAEGHRDAITWKVIRPMIVNSNVSKKIWTIPIDN